MGYNTSDLRVVRTRPCLLADDGSQRNYYFGGKGLGLGDKWKKVNVVVPMPHEVSGKGSGSRPQPETEGPFLRIRHSLKIRIVCRDLGSDGNDTVCSSTASRFMLIRTRL